MQSRIRTLIGVALAAFLLAHPAILRAQKKETLEITGVRIGYPPAPNSRDDPTAFFSVYKHGSWAPVFVDIQCNKPYTAGVKLVVVAPDGDDVPTRYEVSLPQMQPGAAEMHVCYTRPGGHSGDINVVLESEGREITPMFPVPGSGMEQARIAYLAIGDKLETNRLPGSYQGDDAAQNSGRASVEARAAVATITTLNQMPTEWFGYDAMDLVILTTSNRDFANEFASEREGRKAALVEWVRRGGRIIVCLGRNADVLANAGEISELLPVVPTGTREIDVPRVGWKDSTASDEPLGALTIARLTPKPDRTIATLLAGSKANDETPLVLRGPFGFGRVTVVAFDLDEKVLTNWKSRDVFWRELAYRAGPRVTTELSGNRLGFGMPRNFGGTSFNEDSLFGSMIQQMEDFPGVPVISFGWVALFILAYILVVGPLDYYFLKKVVKRLEFTWITFPTVVLLVSAVAYYSAYAIKGSDLRINKYDFVDIDVASKTIVGRSWFTLFSPRIQNYIIGVEPGVPEWKVAPPTNVILGWASQTRQSRQSLFARSYQYAPRASGLLGVPIQVWSTKGFSSDWQANLDPANPIVESQLRHPPGKAGIIGTLTVNFPVPLENAVLISAGDGREPVVRELGSLVPGTPKSVSAQETRPFSTWIKNPASLSDNPSAIGWLPTNMLFHEAFSGQDAQANASLRSLDQSWRVAPDNPNEAILIGTLPRREGLSEEITRDPATATRLWLGAIPEPGKTRPRIDGKMRQETCIRVFIPVRP